MKNVTLDNIINQTSCSPLSLNDFRRYLTFKEHSIENLDFYLWYRSYQIRFNQLPPDVVSILTPSRSVSKEFKLPSDYRFQPLRSLNLQEANKTGDLSDIGCKLQQHLHEYKSHLYNVQPFRDEVNAIMEMFFACDSTNELNIEASTLTRLREEVIYTTHPSIFHAAAMEVYQLMEGDSYIRFKAEAVKNISASTIHFRCIVGIIIMILTFVAVSVTVLLKQSRWLRLILTPLVTCGVSYLISSYRGICAAKVYARMREIKPYELLPLSNSDIPAFVEQRYSKIEVANTAIIQEQKRILLIAVFQIMFASTLLMLLILLVPQSWS